MFKNALAHVQNHYKALLVYAGITASYITLKIIIESLLLENIDTSNPESLSAQYYVISGLLTTIVYSIAQALAFPILGRGIDPILWTVKSGVYTFVRFFSLWFTINLLGTAFQLFIMLSSLSPDTQANLSALCLLFQTILTPFGATLMFYQNTGIKEIAQTFTTMFSQFPYYIGIGFLTFWIYGIFISLYTTGLPDPALPMLEIVSAYLDCVIFAFCWEVCKKHRDELENSDDYDF